MAGFILLAFAGIAVFLPQSIRSSQIDQIDRQLRAALPVAETLAPGSNGAPGLSAAYVARIDPGGIRTVIARPLTELNGSPSLPGAAAAIGTSPHISTVSTIGGSGPWRAALMTLPNGTRL